MLPLNFLTLYETDYDNPGLERSFQKELGVGSSGSIHSMSNLAAMKMLDYDYHRLLFYIKQDSANSVKVMERRASRSWTLVHEGCKVPCCY